MAGSSPWGKIDNVNKLERGISFVSTPGHGGVRVAEAYANAKLSAAARNRGIKQGAYFFFEEDCDYAIPLWELPHLWGTAFPARSPEDVKKSLLVALSDANAPYLVERGIEPEPEAFARWQERERDAELRRSKSPDLIVAASSTVRKDVVEVICADRSVHFVTAESYAARSGINLLSKCVEVAQPADVISRFQR